MRRWMPALGVALLAAVFTWLNRGERVAVELGLFRVYRASLTLVVFLAFLAGMLSMLLLSLRHDRRVREELRARGLLQPAPPRPGALAASAWSVVREPAPPRQDERAAAHPRLDEGASHPNGRTTAYPRLDEGGREDDARSPAHPHLAEGVRDEEDGRPPAYPRLDESGGHENERTAGYPRLDKDPAA